MKQLIVMIAMIGLGIAIAGFILGFNGTASSLASETKAKITYTLINETP